VALGLGAALSLPSQATSDEAKNAYVRAEACLDHGAWQQAKESFTRSITLDPKFSDAYVGRAISENFLNLPKEAISDCTKALTIDSKSVSAYSARSAAFAAIDNCTNALNDASRAIALDPKFFRAYNNRGLVYMSLGQHRKAIADFDEAFRLNARFPSALINRAQAHYQMSDYKAALADCEKIINLAPNDSSVYLTASEICHNMGKFESAVSYARRALQLAPANYDAHVQLAYCLNSTMDYDQALKECEVAIKISPKRAPAYRYRARAESVIGKSENALADMNRAIQLDPNDSYNLPQRAQIFCRLKRYSDAISDCNTSIKQSPKMARAYFIRAYCGDVTGKRLEAISDYLKAIERGFANPAYRRGYINIAIDYERLGQYSKSIEYYDRFLKLYPGALNVLYNRAHAKALAGDTAGAVADYTKIISAEPHSEEACRRRGEIYFNQGAYDKALEDYSISISFDEAHRGITYTARAKVYEKMGKHDLAEADRQTAKKLGYGSASSKAAADIQSYDAAPIDPLSF
jgi:tetratricopeptide (TPR) repeat protein